MQQLLHRVVAIFLLLMVCAGAWGADYVFMSGSNYIIINNSGAITTTTTFSPSTCLWSGTSGGAFTNNGFTLKYSQNSPSGSGTFYYTTTLNSTGTDVPLVVSADGTIQFTANVSATYYNYYIISGWNPTSGTWYIQLNGSNVVASTTSSSANNIKAYLVTTTDYPALTYIEGIEGNDAIGLTGTYNYTRIGSAIATTPACTKYTFNSMNYYKLSDNTITTTNPNPVSEEFTYTWSATCNDATYTGFSINATTGALTLTSLPTVDKTVTITLQATKTGYETQTVTKSVNVSNRPPTGVTGGTVYLNDYEDHRWTYYAGVDESVDGGNYNTNYAGKMYSPNPRNVKITYNGVNGITGSTITVKVSTLTDEDQTSFVYYKTLEEGTTEGQYPYQVISNPFSVRPSTGSGSSKVFYGFAGWKIVSGGEYINGYSNGQTLPLDANITFVNLPYPSINCTSAEIVFETTWTQAKVQRGGGNVSHSSFNGGTYETNFCVINANNNALTPTYPVTITGVEPDGSTTYSYTITGLVRPSNTSAVKMEYVTWNPNGAIAFQNRNVTIGRGVTCSGTARDVTASNGGDNVNQTLKIESGTYGSFTHYSSAPTNNSFVKQHVYLGCDYDRAKNDNTKLTFEDEFLGNRIDGGSGYVQEAYRTYSKSGSFMTNVSISNAAQPNSYYLSRYTTSAPGRSRYLEIEGGEWYANISGGQDNSGSTPNNKTAFTLRMKGGKVRGSIYGAAQQTNCIGDRVIVITGGQIGGWVAGAANGIQSGSGYLYGSTYVYFGGDAEIGRMYIFPWIACFVA